MSDIATIFAQSLAMHRVVPACQLPGGAGHIAPEFGDVTFLNCDT